jgi:hypothetical protein
MEPQVTLELGITDRPLHLRAPAEHRELVLAMARQARRTIHIHTRDLDPAVYDDSDLEEALTQFVLQSKNCQIKILVQDTSRAVKQGHALVRLAQKLSSRVVIKVPDPEHLDYNQAFFVADVAGYIRRPVADLYAAEANFKAPFEARKLIQYFDEAWERADADPNLRQLFL